MEWRKKKNEDKKRHVDMRGGTMKRKGNKNDKKIWMRHINLFDSGGAATSS